MASTVLLQGRLIASTFLEKTGVRLAVAEIKPVEYLLEGNPPPPRGWKKDPDNGIATGPMWILGLEVAALMSADQAEEIGKKLIDAAVQWREANKES
jgi:hypothetical protein